MHPMTDEGLVVGEGLGLGNLVFMVREDQIGGASVYVEAETEIPRRHDRAFDVPPRPPGAPGRGPLRLTFPGRLPQCEVQRMALARVRLHPFSGTHFREA